MPTTETPPVASMFAQYHNVCLISERLHSRRKMFGSAYSISNLDLDYLEAPVDLEKKTSDNHFNKVFIKLHNSFNKQLREWRGPNNVSNFELKRNLSKAASSLIGIAPDAISVQLTSEPSLFFTAKKGDYSCYLELIFDEGTGLLDDSVVTLFNSNENLPSFAGTLEESLEYIESKVTG